MLVLVASIVTFAWWWNSSPRWNSSPQSNGDSEITSTVVSRSNEAGLGSSSQSDVTLTDLYSEIVKMRTDLDTLKATVSEIEQSPSASSNNASIEGESNPQGLGELARYYFDDPEAVALKLAPYLDQQQVDVAEQTERYFAALPDTDSAWSEEAQIFINESLVNPELEKIATTQVNEASCKAGVCKVDISLTNNNGSEFSDEELFEAENRMLVSLSEKFPNSRLRQIEKDGQISFQGYMSDGSVTLPENQIDFNDPVVIEQIRSILQQ